ncbi:Lactamase-B domain-containing protein [Fusarium falciforme]|uniref:Lactamase-B domain-containing protein n=1 Tax=Fusarium falciforme TaxID=195108 RepID=UPI0023014406|nr:Lactamase-B domain-containing protein [Fusarium falciforme]WAO95375.1 Lactamase-B domain-containing protein [Fusarium falciforme]
MSFVSVHALQAGYLTLPERFFVTPLEDTSARTTVPSLSFLIQHTDQQSGKTTRIVFDLGIRRKLEDYAAPIFKHAQTRQPLSGDPDTLESLSNGGLGPDNIDIVMFSHLHWDHVGTPSDYPNSTYVIGPGAAKLINSRGETTAGSHNHFEEGMLDMKRTIELPPTGLPATPPPLEEQTILTTQTKRLIGYFSQPWHRRGHFDAAMDIFGDGSVHVVSAPGHIDGHINLLCRLESGKHVYLGGDSCHDRRLLTGEKDVATWNDTAYPGVVCCIHQNKTQAEKTLRVIRETIRDPGDMKEVEVVFAHDGAWEKQAQSEGRFFPGAL